MGIDYSARLFYGLKIMDDKLINKVNEDDLEVDRSLEIVSSGSCYANYNGDDESDSPTDTFVAIKKSITRVDMYGDNKQIKQEKIMAPKEWHDELISWAKESDCSKYKIGWFLTILEC